MLPNQLSEAELISMMKEGSEAAFSALYAMYARRLYAYCMEYTKSREDSEEIVQDAFVWLWKSRREIRQEATVKNLLFIRVKHYLINSWRARLKSPVFEDYVDYINILPDNSADILEYDDFVAKVNSLIDKLPRTQARVLRLSRIEGLSNKMIAERLSLSEQTVKNSLSIGLKFLKPKLMTIGFLVLLLTFSCL